MFHNLFICQARIEMQSIFLKSSSINKISLNFCEIASHFSNLAQLRHSFGADLGMKKPERKEDPRNCKDAIFESGGKRQSAEIAIFKYPEQDAHASPRSPRYLASMTDEIVCELERHWLSDSVSLISPHYLASMTAESVCIWRETDRVTLSLSFRQAISLLWLVRECSEWRDHDRVQAIQMRSGSSRKASWDRRHFQWILLLNIVFLAVN